MTSSEALEALAELQANVGLLGHYGTQSDFGFSLRARVQSRIDALREHLVEATLPAPAPTVQR